MKSLSDRIRESLEMFIEEFTQELHTRGKNASGKVSESFVIENMGNGMVLSNGSMPLSVLQDGREPGKVPYGFTDILYKWSLDKDIKFSSDSERRSFAYLLGRRIAEQGIEGDPDKWITELLDKFQTKLDDIYYNYVKESLGFK